jgi:hypothetical protein
MAVRFRRKSFVSKCLWLLVLFKPFDGRRARRRRKSLPGKGLWIGGKNGQNARRKNGRKIISFGGRRLLASRLAALSIGTGMGSNSGNATGSPGGCLRSLLQ